MSINYTPKTWTAGSPLLASELNTDVRDFSSGMQGAWTAYTPTYSGLTIGNSVVSARFREIGKTVDVQIDVTLGSTYSGSTVFTVSVPRTMRSGYLAGLSSLGSILMRQGAAPTASRAGGTVFVASTTTVALLADQVSSSATVTNLVPWTWVATDAFSLDFRYEAA